MSQLPITLSTRLAIDDDVIKITSLLNSSLNKKRSKGDNAWGDGNFTPDEVSQLMHEGIVIVLEDRLGYLNGCVQIKTDDDLWPTNDIAAIYLHRLATQDKASGKGYGTILLKACEDYARSINIGLLRLDCDEENEKLCAYYNEQGFTQVGSKIKNNGRVAALFEKKIL